MGKKGKALARLEEIRFSPKRWKKEKIICVKYYTCSNVMLFTENIWQKEHLES